MKPIRSRRKARAPGPSLRDRWFEIFDQVFHDITGRAPTMRERLHADSYGWNSGVDPDRAAEETARWSSGRSCDHRCASRDLDKKALHKDIDADLRKADRRKLQDLRGEVKAARKAWPKARAKAKASCALGRERTSAKAAALRAATLEALRAQIKAMRLKARAACGRKRAEYKSRIQRLTAQLRAERKHQSDMRRILRANKARKPGGPRGLAKARERMGESDDEVRSNIPPHLRPLFERVKRGIKATGHMSRTEAFEHYVESHPREVHETADDETDRMIAAHEAQLRAGGRSLDRRRGRALRSRSR